MNDTVKLIEDISYKFITKDEEFHRLFYMTKTSMKTAIVPDFNSQAVVAIMMRPSTIVRSLQIDKAAIYGDELQVHYTLVDTSSASTFERPVIVVATILKTQEIREATFFSNGVKEYTLKVQK